MTVGGTARRTFALLGRDLHAFVALVLDLLPRLAAVSMVGQAGLAALDLDFVDARRGTAPAEAADVSA